MHRRLLRDSGACADRARSDVQQPGLSRVFFEIAPAFDLVPGFWFEIEGGLGVRFYF